MLRFKILASAVPLIVAGLFARGELMPTARPCLMLGETSVQIAPTPWQAQLHVSFTDDPARATVRVQIVDAADAADFTYVDDLDGAEANGCEGMVATRLVAITAEAAAAGPVIYLSQHGNADYRIFVRSKHLTPREAAAVIVGAGAHPAMQAAAL
jgi:hypothetical protein